jgi:hypothetical protein
MQLQSIFAGNAHDNGYDLIPGRDVTNRRIGIIYWDASGLDGGLVLHLNGEDEVSPDGIDEVQALLAAAGYELDAASISDIETLINEEG